MFAYQIKKRSTIRTVYINVYGETDADKQQRAELLWPIRNFRFHSESTTYTKGPLHIVFNLEGKAIEGYSYNACLFAFTEPTEDFPQGRLIWNDTQYSITTSSKHRYPCQSIAEGPVTSRQTVTELAWNGLLGKAEPQLVERDKHAQWDLRCEVLNMPWDCSPETLRSEVKAWTYLRRAAEQTKKLHVYLREQRAIKRRDQLIARRGHLKLVG